ncbi:MAG: CRISPR-associated protein Cas4, partial [Candidatus Thermoplasmatota archaeon]|nr:CRISPR-associated protein Cas4 [Candidatus Thermoplasmatota archaeon]
SYCPLSWWLSLEHEEDSESLAQGVRSHEKLGKSLWKIDSGEKSARESERIVFWWAIVATVLAVVGLELLPLASSDTLSTILTVVALIWILAALFFLYKAARSTMESKIVSYEKIILVFAIVAVVIATNAVAFLVEDVRLAQVFEVVAILWLVGASYFLYRSLRSTEIADSLRKEFKVKGKIEYIDVDNTKAFRSERYGLSGTPDYVIKVGDNIIPVEEKTGRTPKGPLFSHILQIAAYCLLIEEDTGKAPPYGLLKYPEHEHEIEYNQDLRNMLVDKLAEMRQAMKTKNVHRNHNRPGKCLHCSRRDVCPERLA